MKCDVILFHREVGIRMLSLAGGGSRGLVLAMIVEELERILNSDDFHSNQDHEPVFLSDLFDIIIGN